MHFVHRFLSQLQAPQAKATSHDSSDDGFHEEPTQVSSPHLLVMEYVDAPPAPTALESNSAQQVAVSTAPGLHTMTSAATSHNLMLSDAGRPGTGNRGKRKEAPEFLEAFDWKKFEEAALPSLRTYDPPQLHWWWYAMSCFTHRSKVCAQPPICCAPILQRCRRGVEYGKLSEPDAWFARMLENDNPNTPEFMRGMFWMQDNVAPEVVLTFQSMDWLPGGMQGYIMPKYNWTNDTSCWGTFCFLSNGCGTTKGAWPFTFSPDRKFLNIGPQWIYVMQPGDQLCRPDGTAVEYEPGDMLRLAFTHNEDPTSGLAYQYLVRKVAYLDDRGKIIKTKAYEELKRRALMSDPERGAEFGLYACMCPCLWSNKCPCICPEQLADLFTPMADEQMFQIAPPLQQMWPDVSFARA